MNTRVVLVGSALAGSTVMVMLDAAAKAGLLMVVAVLAVICMRRCSAASRHLVWVCALTGALLMPFSFQILPHWRVLPSWMRWEEAPQLLIREQPKEPLNSLPVVSEIVDIERVVDRSEDGIAAEPDRKPAVKLPEARIFRLPARWLIRGWACGFALLLIPLILSSVFLRRKSAKCREITSGPLFEELERMKSTLGMRRKVTLQLGSESQMPMVWGVLQPCLLLPEKAQAWPKDRLRPVLLHELSHLRRHDPLWLWIGHLALAMHWFNPLVWWAIRQMRMEQEIACDDAVLRHGVRSSDYAGQVIELSTAARSVGESTLALGMARKSGIENRVVGILDPRKNRRVLTRRFGLVLCLLAVLAAGPLAMVRAGEGRAIHRGSILDRNGLVLVESPTAKTRVHPNGKWAAHLLGYVVPGNDQGSSDLAGAFGVEKSYETALSEGAEVKLSLDLRAQQLVERALQDAGAERSAAVVLDCRNGDLLASASFPAFDPDSFVSGISRDDWAGLRDDPKWPMMDRTITKFTPGSTYGVVNALAAARTGKGTMNFECTGSVSFEGGKLNCWIHNMHGGAHGALDLRGGISNSCTCYNAQLGVSIGLTELDIATEVLGMEKVSSQLRKFGPITPARIRFVGLGQDRILATPQQMAVVAAAIGNGGKVWQPRVALNQAPQLRADLVKLGWQENILAEIRAGMDDSVNAPGGTGGAARSDKVRICGKSGTGQTVEQGGRSNNAWFIGYAPAEDPQFAIAVMVQGEKSGGQFCGPIVRKVLEALCDGEK